MKKIIMLILVVVFLMFSFGSIIIAQNSPGPAPDSGDGIPEGRTIVPLPFGNGDAPGPAPDSGDGVPDGSGF